MACPFFVPSLRLETAGWVRPPRLPLGDPWSGSCHARSEEIFQPPETQQRELCNCGYARGRCGQFPDDSPADAVRFSVTSDSGDRVRIVYILERDHAPAAHGSLEYAIGEDFLDGARISETLVQQARAFLESYLRRRIAARAAP